MSSAYLYKGHHFILALTMHFLYTLLSVSTAMGAIPRPRPDDPSTRLTSCSRHLPESTKTVAALVDNYAQVVGNYSDALAKAFLADDFTDMSDSINVLASQPLGDFTFPSKQAFMSSQAAQPKIPLVVTGTYAVAEQDCSD